jgi:hypothetical protein
MSSSVGSSEFLPDGFKVNDPGEDLDLMRAFDLLMTPKALPGTKMFADRAAAMTLPVKATDRACASSKSARELPARQPRSMQATVSPPRL